MDFQGAMLVSGRVLFFNGFQQVHDSKAHCLLLRPHTIWQDQDQLCIVCLCKDLKKVLKKTKHHTEEDLCFNATRATFFSLTSTLPKTDMEPENGPASSISFQGSSWMRCFS